MKIEDEEATEAEEDINLLNYCFDHNFNDTKIKKPLPRQKHYYTSIC